MSFPTWTFDNACQTMEWNELHASQLSISTNADDVNKSTDVLILGVICSPEATEEASTPSLMGPVKEFDDALDGALTTALSENFKSFKNGAKVGASTPTLRLVGSGGAKKVILLGLGTEGKDVDTCKSKLGSTIAQLCDSEVKTSTCTVFLPATLSFTDEELSFITTDYYSSLYKDNRYRTGANVKLGAPDLTSVTLILESNSIQDASAAFARGKAMAEGVLLAKDIVNAPHNILNSESMANVARRIAEESGGTMTCTVLGKEECEARGMGSYLGVARGSETQPQFIHLTYKPASGEVSKKLGIVGKGLLFDTGGYDIKTAMMGLMKFDCGGSAAVFGAARTIGKIAPEGVEAHFIVAACENMINEKAMVPSDVLTASNGKTIEVINTDAEGRLTMADALVYADKEVGCDSIIELSTLTGACMVALGKKICGVWTSDEKLAMQLSDASKVTGEKSWRMPLETEYNDQLESKIADITNCGTRYGGAITAALFLQNFVEDKPYAHIDIAGPVWDDKTCATGFGAKTVTEWITKNGKSF